MSSSLQSREDVSGEGLMAFFLSHPSVTIVKYIWVAYSGSTYARMLTRQRALILAGQNRPLSIHTAVIGGLAVSITMNPTFVSPIGRACAWPDWSSIHLTSSSEALVHCFVAEDMQLYPELMLPSPYQRCPKSCLGRVLQTAEQEYSLSILAGFELEFYLLTESSEASARGSPSPLNQRQLFPWSSAPCLRGDRANCLKGCMLALESSGIIVDQGHAEASMAQFEISLGPQPAMAAVNTVYTAREIIKETASAYGFDANFMPKPFESSGPSGLHLHLSIHDTPFLGVLRDLKTTEGLSRDELIKNFLAGILDELTLLCAIGMPSQQSYSRGPSNDTTGEYVAWGKANSSVPVSEVSQGHWEIRSLDWTANVYLAVAAFVAAGLLGIRNKTALRWEDPGNLTYRLDEETRETLGISEPLPKSFDEALNNLIRKQYGGLQDIMGEEVLDLFVLVKQAEARSIGLMAPAERDDLYRMHF